MGKNTNMSQSEAVNPSLRCNCPREVTDIDNNISLNSVKQTTFNSSVSLNIEEFGSDNTRNDNIINEVISDECVTMSRSNDDDGAEYIDSSGYGTASSMNDDPESNSYDTNEDQHIRMTDKMISPDHQSCYTAAHTAIYYPIYNKCDSQYMYLQYKSTGCPSSISRSEDSSHKSASMWKHSPFIKKVNPRTCCFLQISLLVNIVLIIANCIIFSSQFDGSVQQSQPSMSSLCVLEHNKPPVCSSYSMHLQYLLQVIQSRKNASKSPGVAQSNISPGVAQSNISFKSSKGTTALMENNKSSHRLLTMDSVLFFKDDYVCIGQTASYFISLQLLFKRELRLNHTTNCVIRVSVMKENKDGSHTTQLMTNTLAALNGSQTLQSLQMMGTFILEKGDKITVIVSTPNLVYYCKGCNKITVIEGRGVKLGSNSN